MVTLLIICFALFIDRMVGDPPALWARIPHPVMIFGKAIGILEEQLNRNSLRNRDRRAYGILAIAALLLASIWLGLVLHRALFALGHFGWFIETILVAVMLAQKSLADHVEAVAKGLRDGGLEGGRKAVSMVVGRDPSTLDRSGVARAAIETLAENFSDGVVAPALFYMVFGLPGLFAYKMLNTADSMIGHRSPRYLHFGWASARLDDFANLPAARLSALMLVIGAGLVRGWGAFRRALRVAVTDHSLHRSPNSGWPESAMAGALDLALAGPRVYAGEVVSEPMQNGAGSRSADAAEIEDALRVFWAACTVFHVFAVALFLVSL